MGFVMKKNTALNIAITEFEKARANRSYEDKSEERAEFGSLPSISIDGEIVNVITSGKTVVADVKTGNFKLQWLM